MTTTYKVTGGVPYGDWLPGEEFDADLDPDQEQRAIDRGAIEVVKGKSKQKKEEGNDA